MVKSIFGILVSQFRVLLGTWSKGQGLSETLFLHVWCCTTTLKHEEAVYVTNENYRNPSMEAKYQ